MKYQIYLLDKRLKKLPTKLREKQKFWYPDNVMIKMS